MFRLKCNYGRESLTGKNFLKINLKIQYFHMLAHTIFL